jgi:hypothetical protein
MEKSKIIEKFAELIEKTSEMQQKQTNNFKHKLNDEVKELFKKEGFKGAEDQKTIEAFAEKIKIDLKVNKTTPNDPTLRGFIYYGSPKVLYAEVIEDCRNYEEYQKLSDEFSRLKEEVADEKEKADRILS